MVLHQNTCVLSDTVAMMLLKANNLNARIWSYSS